MSTYLNELAPWERKDEYYQIVQLGKDVKQQKEILSKATKAMIATQITSTNAIIASQERVREGIDVLQYGIDRVEEGIYGLQAAFEWGISEVVWQIEQNREVLLDILEVLMAPLDTQAKELRKRAEDAYANGWFEDALADFLESEKKNRYDFSVQISIGMIYLFQRINKEKALEFFDKAIKYARPKSNYHASFALMHKALIKRDLGLIEEAEKCTSEAVELSPDFAEAIYQNAQYNAFLNRPEKAISLLRKAIELDVNYCEKSHREQDFKKIQIHVTDLFTEFREKECQKAKTRYAVIQNKAANLTKLLEEIRSHESVFIIQDEYELKNCVSRVTELIQRNSYRDYLEANSLMDKFTTMYERVYNDIKSRLEKTIVYHETKISGIKSTKATQTKNVLEKLFGYCLLGVPITIILALRGCLKETGRDWPLNAFGSLISILFWGIIITIGIYYISKFVILGMGEPRPSEFTYSETAINRTKDFISKLENMK